MANPNGTPIWFELTTNDQDKAEDFYADVVWLEGRRITFNRAWRLSYRQCARRPRCCRVDDAAAGHGRSARLGDLLCREQRGRNGRQGEAAWRKGALWTDGHSADRPLRHSE